MNTDYRLSHYMNIDENARKISIDFLGGLPVTEQILSMIVLTYQSAKVERKFNDDFFDTAYHAPITSELEFFISRVLYHLSTTKNLGWKILLRKQEKKTAPDIRLLKNGKTFAIIEVKAKAGWIQPFLSPERFHNDELRFREGKGRYDPTVLVAASRLQLEKYYDTFGITRNDVFLFLPTLALVHRKRYTTDIRGYYEYFERTSGLPQDNLILLSHNMRLDLSTCTTNEFLSTNNFENLLTKLLAY